MSGVNTTIDDVNPRITYSTSPSWNTNVWADQRPQPLYGTNHGTPNPGASATFTFDGTAIYVYGYKWTDHGYRDIAIDGDSPVRCDGRQGSQGSQALVYWADNLSPGNHTITFQHTGDQGQYLNLDFFIVTQGVRPSTPRQNKSTPIAAIVGASVGAAVLAILFVLIWFIRSRKKKQQRQRQQEAKTSPVLDSTPWASNGAPTQAAVVHPFQNPNPYTIQPYAQNHQRGSSTSLGYPHSVDPTNTSSKYSQNRPSHTGYGTSVGGASVIPSSAYTQNTISESRPTSSGTTQLDYYREGQPWPGRTSSDTTNQFQSQPQPQPQPQHQSRPQFVSTNPKAQYRGSHNDLSSAGATTSSTVRRPDSPTSPKDNPPPYAI
ncbi:hypothetical protein CPB86DRAFT_778991 [Serendipita vermifera]|nr:hypothetical protein CPB86DRAFT_778991 [Serendipita vermifera]